MTSKLSKIFRHCSALLEGVESEARDDHGRWTSGGGSGGSGGKSSTPPMVMAKHAQTVSEKARQATQAATGGNGPLAKSAAATHVKIVKRGHGAKDHEHKQSSNEHAAHAREHEEIAKRTKDPKAKAAHAQAAKLHRAAATAHHNTAHGKLSDSIGADF